MVPRAAEEDGDLDGEGLDEQQERGVDAAASESDAAASEDDDAPADAQGVEFNLEDVTTIDPALKDLFTLVADEGFEGTVQRRLGEIICNLATPHSVCLVVSAASAQVLLDLFPDEHDVTGWEAKYMAPVQTRNWRQSGGGDPVIDTADYASVQDWMHRSPFGDPHIADILTGQRGADAGIPQALMRFLRYIARNAMRAFPNVAALRQAKHIPIPDPVPPNKAEMDTYTERTTTFPFHEQVRGRGGYVKDTKEDTSGLCAHAMPSHRKQTAGYPPPPQPFQ